MKIEVINQNMNASLVMDIPITTQYIGSLTEEKKVHHYFKSISTTLDNLLCDFKFSVKQEGGVRVYTGDSDVVSIKITA